MLLVGGLFSFEVASARPFLSPPVQPARPIVTATMPPNAHPCQVLLFAMIASFAARTALVPNMEAGR
jgi:hypothetical protein